MSAERSFLITIDRKNDLERSETSLLIWTGTMLLKGNYTCHAVYAYMKIHNTMAHQEFGKTCTRLCYIKRYLSTDLNSWQQRNIVIIHHFGIVPSRPLVKKPYLLKLL